MEALLLGVSSGLVCVASCGPVVLPWLAFERSAWRTTAKLLGLFLVGRLAGYLAFGVLAWAVGLALPSTSRTGTIVFAVAHLALAAALVIYVLPRRERCAEDCSGTRAVRLSRGLRRLAPLAFGLLTGLSPCPPFLAAGVRAAETGSLAGSLGFFALFFVGTSLWFVPFAAVAALRRVEALSTVARFTALIVAAYYGYLGAATLGGALLHG
jgi:sulfite exporter TauE/SafE